MQTLIVDTFSVVYDLLKPYASAEFWEFSTHESVPGAVYVIGRQQLLDNKQRVIDMAESGNYTMIFDGAAEGSITLVDQIRMLGLDNVVLSGKLKILSGGDMDSSYPYLLHDHFFNVILGYEHNIVEMARMPELYAKQQKPYKFLFLNGRARPQRKYIWERFKQRGLLDSALWTMLEGRPVVKDNTFTLLDGATNLMATTTPITQLPEQYETPRYRSRRIRVDVPERTFIKQELFDNTWGEIYLQAEPYIDTYFSLVTETVVTYPHSFRTEKIAKPLAIGHPWIAAANAGFYRDIRNLGFKTFDHLIDERFDSIDNTQDRMDRIIQVVDDLCRQDLVEFLSECHSVCKYNQLHLQHYREQLRRDFPARFTQFINE